MISALQDGPRGLLWKGAFGRGMLRNVTCEIDPIPSPQVSPGRQARARGYPKIQGFVVSLRPELRPRGSRAAHEEESAQAYSTVRRALFPSATP
jgi:hypothetical protein